MVSELFDPVFFCVLVGVDLFHSFVLCFFFFPGKCVTQNPKVKLFNVNHGSAANGEKERTKPRSFFHRRTVEFSSDWS